MSAIEGTCNPTLLAKDKRVAGPSQATKYQRATPSFFGGEQENPPAPSISLSRRKGLLWNKSDYRGFTTPTATVADNSMFEAFDHSTPLAGAV
jgi:hypothetical protein